MVNSHNYSIKESEKPGRKLNHYRERIAHLPNDEKLSTNLEEFKDEITFAYAGGKINKEQNDTLTNNMSMRYKKNTRNKNEG